MLMFALDRADPGFAEALARDLDVTIAPHEERVFEDGEHKLRPLVEPRGEDAYVVLSLHERLGERVAVASPDPGGIKRAQLWREISNAA